VIKVPISAYHALNTLVPAGSVVVFMMLVLPCRRRTPKLYFCRLSSLNNVSCGDIPLYEYGTEYPPLTDS
jgi:hypothetical protein